MVTANTYLSQAGPAGSVLGLVLGALVMLVVARNYAYLMRCYPEAGGAYSFSREVFGHDYGFLTAWFVAITYLAMLWANATSLPLFCKIFLGNVFQFGRLYTLFGYDVYLGEALLSLAAILIVALVCARAKRLSVFLMTGMACLFCAGVVACFAAGMAGGTASMSPGFVPDSSALTQVVRIALISPWAFIGFESISHGTEEFSFGHDRIRRVLVASVVATLVLYGMIFLLSVTAHPAQYASWIDYIGDLGNLEGLEALPAFYAAHHYLGDAGVTILMLSLLSLVITSLIGNMTALSRLVYAMARDAVLPARLAELDGRQTPARAVWLIAVVSCVVPFLGRTAIGWIVDVTNIGAVLIYGIVSAATFSLAGRMGDRAERTFGLVGLVLMLAFGASIILPNLVTRGSLETQTYFLFIVWSVLGFLFFRNILRRDKERRFGNSIIVWIAPPALVLLIALIWMRQSMIASNDAMAANVASHYAQVQLLAAERAADQTYVEGQMLQLDEANARTMVMAVVMFVFALVIMLNNHTYLSHRSQESELLANTDPMTGVKNKHAWMMKENELNAAITEGRAEPFAIAVADVNGLKKINDTLGHKAGDEYIKAACDMVCDIYQKSPVYRIGGDEFVILLTGSDHTVRKELKQLIHDRSVEHIGAGGVVISVGMSDFDPERDANAHDAFERADSLMYEEKTLLKSLGSITRDEEPDGDALISDAMQAKAQIINVRRTILVVEDVEVNQQMLGAALEEGYELLYAADGLDALRQIRESRDELALVMLDLNLPSMNGMDILREMRKDADLKRIPVVVLTVDGDAEVECLRLGAMDFIPKPYPNPETIRARISKCIELSENKDMIQSTERDQLTRLFNVDYFRRYVQMYDQHYWDMAMDAVVVDVNHFHMINERYGRPYGDSVLKSVGAEIRQFAREVGGVACRKDADVFLLYCPYREDYAPLLQRIAGHLAEDGSASSRVRVRLGVYAQVDKSLEIDRRFDRAKAASSAARSNLAQPIGVYDAQMHEEELYRERLLEDFHASILERRFTIFLQPKFDIRHDAPVLASAEALVRWNHPKFGMIAPSEFIHLLEDNGLILELDQFVWRETARHIHDWKERFGFSVPVSVNVSRIDMLMPNLKDIFAQILADEDLTTDDIVLEITESAYTGDSEQVISTAHELRGMGMGFRIEMDDFGTGYSSLGMLSRLPIDALKLDMTFVSGAFEQTKDVRMIELILDIADYLHVPVVAEGVETEEQYLALKFLGCDMVQGYYFSRPVPADEFDRFLVERGA